MSFCRALQEWLPVREFWLASVRAELLQFSAAYLQDEIVDEGGKKVKWESEGKAESVTKTKEHA